MTTTPTTKTAAETALAAAFGAEKDRLPGSSAIRSLREAAFEAFDARGLPHRRVEEWRYTDLRSLMRDAKPLARSPDAAAVAKAAGAGSLFAVTDPMRVVIADGSFVPSLSNGGPLPAGLTIRPLSDALSSGDDVGLGVTAPVDNPALALNAAFMTDGVVIDVAAGAVIERPIHIAVVHTGGRPQAVYTRSIVRVGAGATATVFETFEGPAGIANQTNAAMAFLVGDGAVVRHVKAQRESLETLHLSTLLVELGAKADFRTFALAAGSSVARNQSFLRYAGPGSHATLAGTTVLAGRRHSDTTLVVDHASPGGESRELFKVVVDGEARSVFQGKIIVRQEAQKTDGRMMSQAVMLSEGGEVNNKPELEIFADDVACAHGATCGALDEDLLFYLKARGLPAKEAETLLVQAFLGEAIETVENEAAREALNATVVDWLGTRV